MNPTQWQYVKKHFQIVEGKLDKVLLLLRQDGGQGKGHFAFGVGPVTNKNSTKGNTMDITITNEQKVNVQLNPVTGGGRPATVDGVPTWEVVNGNSTVVPAADGLSADLISSDDPGDTQFLVKADADLGQGVEEISDTINLTVLHANATALGLVASAPTNK